MAITVKPIRREFTYNGVTLPDPGVALSPVEVQDMYAVQYPDLVTARIETETVSDDLIRYKFVRSVGTKG